MKNITLVGLLLFTIPHAFSQTRTRNYPVTERGWTLEELKKVSGENFLRMFEEVERKAAALKQVKTK